MDIQRFEEGADLIKKAMRILAVALVFGVLVPVVKAGDDRPIVVVFDVDGARAGLSKAFLRDLADYLSSKLTESRRFAVVPREQLRRCLLVQKRKSHKPRCDESCRIELGRELAAEKTMSTRVMKLGRRCTVTLTLYDLKRATTEAAATKHGSCGENGVIETVDAALVKLFGEDVAIEAKRAMAKEIRQAYDRARQTKGSVSNQLGSWKSFVSDYPDDNPYLKTAQRKIKTLGRRAAAEAREAAKRVPEGMVMVAAGEFWMGCNPKFLTPDRSYGSRASKRSPSVARCSS